MGIFDDFLLNENKKEYKIKLNNFLDNNEYIPSKEDIYRAFLLTPFENTKVVILGQDPYPNKEDACGLAFSASGIPASLRNIFKELNNDLNIDIPKTGDLTSWAKQGVLLLNTVLTTKPNESLSHKNIGWEIFSSNYIKLLNDKKDHLVFILWGNNAIKYEYLIDKSKHLIISSSHPSPLSARVSFFNSKPFSKTNNYLVKHGIKEIDWQL